MIVTILSCFRNATHYIPRYFDQVNALAVALAKRGDKLTLVLGYGDSTDGTDAMLHEEAMFSMGALLVDVSHGGPRFSSIVSAQRFKQLAHVANNLSACIDKSADVILWIESDLIWQPETIAAMIDHLEKYPAVAPLVMEISTGQFYDVWGYRANGVQFTKKPPFHQMLNGDMLKLDSAGSCVAIRADLGRKLRFPEEDVFVGWCRQLYAQGGSIWLDPTLRVEHP